MIFQCINILKRLTILIIFQNGSLKDYLMKLLNLLLSLIIISYTGNKVRVTFGGSCLEQDKITFNHGKIVNICTIYEISVADSNDNYPTLEKCVFGAVK